MQESKTTRDMRSRMPLVKGQRLNESSSKRRGLGVGLCFTKAKNRVAHLPLTALLQNLYSLEAL